LEDELKNFLYIFAVWVLFNNGELWKYPQAQGFTDFGPQKSYLGRCFSLISVGEKSVVNIPQYKVKKIGFSMEECRHQSYRVFHNPSCFNEDGSPVHSDDIEVYYTKNHVRTERSSEGRDSMPPAYIVHFDDVKNDWR
jgi:hypothetical protein